MPAMPFRELALLWLRRIPVEQQAEALAPLFQAAPAAARSAFKAQVKADLSARLGAERDGLDSQLKDISDS